MNELNLTFTLEEVNVLLEGLGEQSFKQVHQLINKIQTQATGQLQDAQADSAEADSAEADSAEADSAEA